jgi:hypothetical protein|tara:strand:- start:1368 stop:1622 length:255 start_codon:yes stop_codon:yes gene_type:complete
MKEVKKLQKEEVTKLSDYQLRTNEAVGAIGQIELQFDLLKDKKEELLNSFKELRIEQQSTADELQKKYGDGNIDLEKGEFIPLK